MAAGGRRSESERERERSTERGSRRRRERERERERERKRERRREKRRRRRRRERERAAMFDDLEAILGAPEARCAFLCKSCHSLLFLGRHVIQDLNPFSGTHLLVDTVYGVVNGRLPVLDVYLMGTEDSERNRVDLNTIYCMSCGFRLGSEIVALIGEEQWNPMVHAGRFVMEVRRVEVVFENGVEFAYELLYKSL